MKIIGLYFVHIVNKEYTRKQSLKVLQFRLRLVIYLSLLMLFYWYYYEVIHSRSLNMQFQEIFISTRTPSDEKFQGGLGLESTAENV